MKRFILFIVSIAFIVVGLAMCSVSSNYGKKMEIQKKALRHLIDVERYLIYSDEINYFGYTTDDKVAYFDPVKTLEKYGEYKGRTKVNSIARVDNFADALGLYNMLILYAKDNDVYGVIQEFVYAAALSDTVASLDYKSDKYQDILIELYRRNSDDNANINKNRESVLLDDLGWRVMFFSVLSKFLCCVGGAGVAFAFMKMYSELESKEQEIEIINSNHKEEIEYLNAKYKEGNEKCEVVPTVIELGTTKDNASCVYEVGV